MLAGLQRLSFSRGLLPPSPPRSPSGETSACKDNAASDFPTRWQNGGGRGLGHAVVVGITRQPYTKAGFKRQVERGKTLDIATFAHRLRPSVLCSTLRFWSLRPMGLTQQPAYPWHRNRPAGLRLELQALVTEVEQASRKRKQIFPKMAPARCARAAPEASLRCRT